MNSASARCLLALLCVAASAATSSAQEAAPPVQARIVACFAPDADQETIDEIQRLVDEHNANCFVPVGRWPGTNGTPLNLTWSLVPDGLVIPGMMGDPTSPSTLFATLDSQFATIGGRATWLARIQSCFDRWQALSGLSFTRIQFGGADWDDGAAWGSAGAAGARGDIRISLHPTPGLFAYAQFPFNGDIVLNTGPGGPAWAPGGGSELILRDVLMHEIGHAIGLDHTCGPNPSLMTALINYGYDGPQHDDLRGAHFFYGDPYESDDTPATANDLGVIAVGTTLANTCTVPAPLVAPDPPAGSICSLDADARIDYWKFTTTTAGSVTCTITPVGLVYPTSCGGGPSGFDSGLAANLKLELLNASGTSVLAVASSNPAGAAETITGIVVPPGAHLLRVSETSTTTTTQLYTLSIQRFDDCAGLPDCNGNGVLDSCDLTLGSSSDVNASGVPDECEGLVANAFCFGDQQSFTFTPCPCDNAGAIGHGCANSAQASGALLTISGVPAPVDMLHLDVSSMPAATTVIFLKGDVNITNGVVFGDGVRCVDSFLRMGTAGAVGGAASYPQGSQVPISVRGNTPIGSGLVGYYQAYYRNASASFCPPDTFNVSNGFQVTW